MSKAKVTLTLDAALVADLDRLGEERHESRSHLVEIAIRMWRRSLLEQQLIEGYRAMSRADIETAEDRLAAAAELLE